MRIERLAERSRVSVLLALAWTLLVMSGDVHAGKAAQKKPQAMNKDLEATQRRYDALVARAKKAPKTSEQQNRLGAELQEIHASVTTLQRQSGGGADPLGDCFGDCQTANSACLNKHRDAKTHKVGWWDEFWCNAQTEGCMLKCLEKVVD